MLLAVEMLRSRPLLGLLLVALGPPTAAAAAICAWRSPEASCGLAICLGAVSALALYVSVRAPGRCATRVLLSLSVASFLLAWPEVGLRVAGFRADPAGAVHFGYPNPRELLELDTDAELFWKLPKEAHGVNSHGFMGPEFEIQKAPGVKRIVFFGDSVTMQGYPRRVARVLNERLADDLEFEAVNLGVAGYTSYQGRVLAERWTSRLDPDVGVIFFGWNDHWLAYGAPDSRKAFWHAGSIARPVIRASRLVQWLIRASAGPQSSLPLDESRVSLEEYRNNLTAIGERIERSGGQVVVVTAPSAHPFSGVPDYLVDLHLAANREAVLQLHAEYNEAAREVARSNGWLLLDCEREVDEQLAAALFVSDGIHLRTLGKRWLAGRIARLIEERVAAAWSGGGDG